MIINCSIVLVERRTLKVITRYYHVLTHTHGPGGAGSTISQASSKHCFIFSYTLMGIIMKNNQNQWMNAIQKSLIIPMQLDPAVSQ